MRRALAAIGLLLVGLPANAAPPPNTPWAGQCSNTDLPSTIGCQPQASLPIGTNLVLVWQSTNTPKTRSMQVQQILNATLPATFSTLHATGAASLDSNLSVAGNATISGTFGVTGATSLGSTLVVTGATNLLSILSVSGATNLLSSLSVSGATSLIGGVTIHGPVTLDFAGTALTLGATSNAELGGTLKVGSGGTITGFGYAVGNAMGPLVLDGASAAVGTSAELTFARLAPSASDGSDFRFHRNGAAISGGTSTDINKALWVQLDPGAADGSSEWGFLSRSRSDSAVGGQMVAGYLQSWRNAGSNAWIWGAVVETADFTGLDSATVGNPTSGMEVDLGTSEADNAVNPSKFGGFGNRHLVHYVAVRNSGSNQNEISTGLWFGTTNTFIDSVIGFQNGTRFYQALDTRGATSPVGSTQQVAAVRMASGQVIDFKGGAALNSPNGRYWFYNNTMNRLEYFNGDTAAELVRIDDDGTFTIPATIVSGTDVISQRDVSATRFMRFPTYNVGTLPAVTSADAGVQVWVTNCRESGEGGGAGTGCMCYVDKNGVWKAVWSGVAPGA